jgi:hypothetical protein
MDQILLLEGFISAYSRKWAQSINKTETYSWHITSQITAHFMQHNPVTSYNPQLLLFSLCLAWISKLLDCIRESDIWTMNCIRKFSPLSLLSEQKKKHRDWSKFKYFLFNLNLWPPLWSSGQIQRSWVRFPALPDFQRSSVSGAGSSQPREYNWGTTERKSSSSELENREYGRRDPLCWPCDAFYLQTLSLT